VIKNLQLKIILSKILIKSVKFKEDINIYLRTYNNNSFSTKNKNHFKLTFFQNLIENLTYIEICFKHKIFINSINKSLIDA